MLVCLPDEDVALAAVVLDGLGNAVSVITVTAEVDAETKVLGKRSDGVTGTTTAAIYEYVC